MSEGLEVLLLSVVTIAIIAALVIGLVLLLDDSEEATAVIDDQRVRFDVVYTTFEIRCDTQKHLGMAYDTKNSDISGMLSAADYATFCEAAE